MVSSLKSEKGFTLVEILISMVILGIAFMGLANMQLSSINSNSNSSQLTRAIILAQDKMEEIKSLNPDHPDLADINTIIFNMKIFQETLIHFLQIIQEVIYTYITFPLHFNPSITSTGVPGIRVFRRNQEHLYPTQQLSDDILFLFKGKLFYNT